MSHNSSSSDHEKSRNLRSLQAVASVVLEIVYHNYAYSR